MATRVITERVQVQGALSGARVDRERGIIYGVKLSGRASQNGNDYPATTFRRDIGKYEGVVVGFNHRTRGEAQVEDVGGRIKNARIDENGEPRGDAHLLLSHPLTARVLEAAANDSRLFGFSHVVEAQCRPGKDGRQVVESITRVISCDIVARPATTQGLWESVGGNRDARAAVPTDGATFAESVNATHEHYSGNVPTDGAAFAASVCN